MHSMNKLAIIGVALLMTVTLFAQDRFEGGGDFYEEDEYAFSWLVGKDFRPFLQAELSAGGFNHITIPTKENFNYIPTGEVRFGYSEHWRFKRMIPQLDERYVSFGYGMSDIERIQPDSNKIHSTFGRFGIGNRMGYGYKLGPIALIPYHQIEVMVNSVDFIVPNNLELTQDQLDVLERYPGKARLGLSYGGGAKLDLFRKLSVNAAYETNIIYPRLLFGQWLGSFIIQEIGMGIATYFGDDIVEASPLFGPLLYWGIKNGLSLLYFSQLREGMNWPFKSEAPISYVNLKLGVQLTF